MTRLHSIFVFTIIVFTIFFFSTFINVYTNIQTPSTTRNNKLPIIPGAKPTKLSSLQSSPLRSSFSCNDITSPKLISTHSKDIRYLHTGKDGGGSFSDRISRRWRILIEECHPGPCRWKSPMEDQADEEKMVEESVVVETQQPSTKNNKRRRMAKYTLDDNGEKVEIFIRNNKFPIIPGANPTKLLLLIRDPLDRFMSSFNYNQLIACWPELGDKRIPTSKVSLREQDQGQKNPWENPMHYCIDRDSYIRKGIEAVQKVRNNFTRYAESLCSDPNEDDGGAKDLDRSIEHLRYHLVDWLPSNWSTNSWIVDNLVPVVMERGFDFNRQIDSNLEWALAHGNFTHNKEGSVEDTKFTEKDLMERKNYVECQDKLSSEAEEQDDEHKTHSQHSSKTTIGDWMTTLSISSEKGKRCAIQHLAEDYKVLQDLYEKSVCKVEECEVALKSILDRRRDYLS